MLQDEWDSFIQQIYTESGTLLGAGDTSVKKQMRKSCPHEADILVAKVMKQHK